MAKQISGAQALMQALVLGATAHLKPNVAADANPVSDAYVALTNLISLNYPSVEAHLLDIGPHSDARQQQLAAQLAEAGAEKDEAVVAQAQHLLKVAADQEFS